MEFEVVCQDRPSKCTWKPNATNSPHNPDISKPNGSKSVIPNILHAVGQTPMVNLNHIPKNHGIKCKIFAKCEFMNPGGSVKDRMALRMVEEAEKSGLLKAGYTIIEPTSGNTGVGLAMVAAVKDYQCLIVIPEGFSDEKVKIMKALGAKIVRTPIDAAWNSPEGLFAVAQSLHKQTPNSVILGQFVNPANPLVHYNRTATEIWEQCDGKIDYLVGGLGTGGTISGIGRRLRELSPSTKIIVADPRKPLEKCLNPENRIHSVEGIGIPFTPTVTDLNVIDAYVKTDEKICLHLSRELVKEEGLLCGGSSGASLAAALSVAKDLPADKRVVIILQDTIRNYMTKFLSDSWMEWKGFLDLPKPLSSNEWWWNLTVSEIHLNKPVILASNTSGEKALSFLQKEGIRQALIAHDEGGIKGLVTLDKLLTCLISGEMKHSELAIKALVKQFKRITKTTSLGRLSRIIQDSLYAVVFDQDNDDALVGVEVDLESCPKPIVFVLHNFLSAKIHRLGLST